MFRILALVALAAFLNGTGAPEFVSGGTANPKLSGPLVAGGDAFHFRISADGQTVVYYADQETDGVYELYSVPIDGSTAPVKVSGPMVAGAFGIEPFVYTISPDNARIAYSADQEEAGVFELYSAPIDGSATSTPLHTPLFCSADGDPCETDPDCPDLGSCAVGGEICETNEDCPGLLNSCLFLQPQACDPLGTIAEVHIDPAGAYVVYLLRRVSLVAELYSVPIDGSAPSATISTAVFQNADGVDEFEIAPAGDRIVYRAEQDTVGVPELYSAPIDGSEAAVRLNAELVAGGEVIWYEISPDGTEVFYLADQETDEVREIYIVPIDGSAAPEKLSGPTVGDGVRGAPALSHDGTRLIYIQDAPAAREVYSVSIDGSAAPIKLSHPLDPGDNGYTKHVSPDSPWVVYLTETGGGWDYYSVTIDGSDGPHLLQAVNGDDKGIFVRGHRLIYLFQPGEGERDFFSVPLDGSQPPVPLGGGVFYSYANIGPDFFAYIPVPPAGESDAAYAIPHAWNLPPVLLNAPPTLFEGEIVAYPRFNSGETWFVYIADQDTDDVRELYSRHFDLDDDGTPDETDSCPRSPNPGQGPVVFGQDVLATSKIAFSWGVTADVSYVRGPLDSVDAYATDDNGSLPDVVTYTDAAEPAGGAGFYYLFKPGGSCSVGSWQSVVGANPARDAILP